MAILVAAVAETIPLKLHAIHESQAATCSLEHGKEAQNEARRQSAIMALLIVTGLYK